jgi:outer membrane receptor for ferrienterochelin and colicin
MYKAFFCIGFILFLKYSFAQKHTISGYVSDFKNGEKLIGASVFDKQSKIGTITNPYGFYSLTLPNGKYEIVYSQIGYGPVNLDIELSFDTTINIDLNQEIQIDEVTVLADKVGSKVESSQMSEVKLSTETIKSIPALLGEVDVIKAIQLLPGVQSGTEGTSGMYVRGGGPDQNLILLDGIPVYNVNHLFGFFSVFNSDGINSVNLITGGFPARYGGRLSSVLDINMKEGSNNGFHGTGSIGIIASRLTLEGPIIKDKMTFIVSARRTYADILARPFIKMQQSANEEFNFGYFFYDINSKINYKFSEKSRIYLSAYLGNDKAYSKEKYNFENNSGYSKSQFQLRWGNIIAALRWNYMFSNKLFSNTTLSYSRYKFLTGYEDESEYNGDRQHSIFDYFSGIDDWAAKFELYFVPNPNHYLRFGLNDTYHTFNPGVNVYSELYDGAKSDTSIGNNKIYGNELFAYAEDEITWNNFKTNIGIHA